MTEHSAVIFVFFFLAEYASIVLMCILISILYLGGYNMDYYIINYTLNFVIWIISDLVLVTYELINYIIYGINTSSPLYLSNYSYQSAYEILYINSYFTNPLTENFVYAFVIGFKTFIMIFVFIWVRASFPRIRYDQLMSYCWTVLLPLIFAFILLIPCILYAFEMLPANGLFF